ncbi:hypothetical protein [Leptolyngbya sp. KIOST-1]|uniref:hypothetical protein n=1 Tax=Leptolyngbya sp. KIOST-1 TaxID=1229172 RepID=UPI00056320D5|nr:hypothetical protein [Leptolyngbya sp. KIOST-1]
MAPKKLTEADKTSILSLYRQPQETTSTLAERYGVSNSTISRLLKASLPEAEYSVLIQQKRGADKAVTAPAPDPAPAKPRRQTNADPDPEVSAPVVEVTLPEAPTGPPEETPEAAPPPPKPTRKRRSQAAEPIAEPAAEESPEPAQLSLPDPPPAPEKPARPVLKSAQAAAPSSPPADEPNDAAEASVDLDDDWDDDDDALLGDDYGDDDDDDDDGYPWEGGDTAGDKPRPSADAAPGEPIEIAPLTAEALPSLCYVVVERTSSELVVLPLRTFAELGQIPEAEGDSRTLPVFENHNVARRFSRRNQRVVKVPDGSLLQTTSPYLQAKGITRLLIDGQVFSLGQDSVEPVAAGTGE